MRISDWSSDVCSSDLVSPEETWGSETTALGTTISVARTAHPSESLMHELLHADLKLKGFRQHLTMLRVDENDMVQHVVQALENEQTGKESCGESEGQYIYI